MSLSAARNSRIEFDEKASADASHKKFSDKKLPESRATKKNGRAWSIVCLSDMKTADTWRSSKGRIAGIDSMCIALVVLRDYYVGEDKAQESLDGSR